MWAGLPAAAGPHALLFTELRWDGELCLAMPEEELCLAVPEEELCHAMPEEELCLPVCGCAVWCRYWDMSERLTHVEQRIMELVGVSKRMLLNMRSGGRSRAAKLNSQQLVGGGGAWARRRGRCERERVVMK